MSIDLAKLSKEDLVKLLSRQSRKLIKTGRYLEKAYRRLAEHGCKGALCTECGKGKINALVHDLEQTYEHAQSGDGEECAASEDAAVPSEREGADAGTESGEALPTG